VPFFLGMGSDAGEIVLCLVKPIPILLVLAATMNDQAQHKGVPGPSARYSSCTSLGLVFSAVGDILLELKTKDFFLFGLVAFLIAQVFYILAFTARTDGRLIVKPLVGAASYLYAFGLYAVLHPRIAPSMRLPCFAYALALATMCYTAGCGVSSPWSQATKSQRWALVGGILFVISDSILAIAKFYGPFVLARTLNMSTYYASQYAIGASAWLYPKLVGKDTTPPAAPTAAVRKKRA